MLVAEDAAAERQHLFLKRAGAGQVALAPERAGQVVHAGDGVWVLVAQFLSCDCQRTSEPMGGFGIECRAVP